MRRLVHLSDLHFGRSFYPALEALKRFIRGQGFDLVIVSGDLTQRSRRREFREAAEFLASLGTSTFVVPGNHDIPLYKLWRRFWNPFKNYRAFIQAETEPVHADDEIVVVGANTVSLWTAEGRFAGRRWRGLTERLPAPKDDEPLKILVSHHPIPAARLVGEKLGFDVFLSGHTHHPLSELLDTGADRNVLCIAAGTSSSTRLRDDFANSFNVLEIESRRLGFERYEWDPSTENFFAAETKAFEKNAQGWRKAEATR